LTQQRCVLRVGQTFFQWRLRQLRHISAFRLPLHTTIAVYRGKHRIDQGAVVVLTGQDQRALFSGFSQTAPASERFYSDSAIPGGVVREIYPAWFVVGDRVILSVSPKLFEAQVREWPEYF